MSVIHIESKAQFDDQVRTFAGISLVDFWAERCGPCRMLGPVLEQLAEDNAGKAVQIVKINVEENPDLAEEFGISSIPAVYLMQAGNTLETIIGVNPKPVYQGKIDAVLAEMPADKKEDDMPMAA